MCRKCECEICLLPFDADLNRPKILPCGHTLCAKCASIIVHDACPFDRMEFEGLVYEELADNYFVLQQLVWEQLKCSQHQRVTARSFCCTHLRPLCGDCVKSHPCTVEDLSSFDVTCYLFKELSSDLSIASLSNSEKLARLLQRRNLQSQTTVPQATAQPELSLDRFGELLPKNRTHHTFAWRLDVSERQIEALSFRVDQSVALSGISVGALVSPATIGKVKFVKIAQGLKVDENATTLVKDVPLSPIKTRMKVTFCQREEIQAGVWYTLAVKMTGGCVFTGKPQTANFHSLDRTIWELREPEDSGKWLTTGENSKGGPILQLFYYRL